MWATVPKCFHQLLFNFQGVGHMHFKFHMKTFFLCQSSYFTVIPWGCFCQDHVSCCLFVPVEDYESNFLSSLGTRSGVSAGKMNALNIQSCLTQYSRGRWLSSQQHRTIGIRLWRWGRMQSHWVARGCNVFFVWFFLRIPFVFFLRNRWLELTVVCVVFYSIVCFHSTLLEFQHFFVHRLRSISFRPW